MADKIKLVQGDTRPTLICTLTDETTGLAIPISGATPRLKFRVAGATTLIDTIVGVVLDGPNGLCKFEWSAIALAGDPGDYEGEIELTFEDGTIQTVFDLLKFKMRAQF